MNFMESFVVSVGGSMINPSSVDVEYIKEFSKIIKSVDAPKIGIVVGGGQTARTYVNSMKNFTDNDFFLDEIGIMATRLNAKIVKSSIGKLELNIPEDVNEAVKQLLIEDRIVMGGTVPGHTTDTVSVLLAEAVGIKKVYNLTSVDRVYEDDPKKNPKAKAIETMNYKEAFSISLKSYTGAGSNQFMDSVALLIAMRSGIEINLMHGKDLNNFKNALKGEKFIGTKIRAD
ncbi:MAG: uridylate kinase [Thermoplasmatales archaeon Gpl]|jgi:uridylate kinase|uniref:Uridylate kinase n=2 Tax=Cuniculiplasma divulgatum TaxID=1673428 RepID=A0A1R4A885_9ARCH|nr:MAG: uridylate kinase [Thermoplasmatales archaeon Gpl]SJK85175.1 uridylate kinase [Cuniculiplasma divulgatum]